MKRTFFLAVLLMTVSIQRALPAVRQSLPDESKGPVVFLVINADVTVVLVGDPNQVINRVGDTFFMEQVIFRQKGNRLIITATKKKDFRGRGVIFIPVAGLEQIEINRSAKISSTTILQVPKLKLAVNGECDVNILIKGTVELMRNDAYEIDYHSRDLPQAFSTNREKPRKLR